MVGDSRDIVHCLCLTYEKGAVSPAQRAGSHSVILLFPNLINIPSEPLTSTKHMHAQKLYSVWEITYL